MKLTYKTEYALLALIFLARKNAEERSLAEDISHEQAVPKKFLQQILTQLKQAGYVKASRGKSGGYVLAKDPKKISVAEIVRLFDGPIAPSTAASKHFYAKAPIEKEKKALQLLSDIREFTAAKLEGTTISQLV